MSTKTRDVSNLTDVSKIKRNPDGSIKIPQTYFRNFIAPGTDFEPEPDRYHLYAAFGCPWTTRTLIMRKLKGLDDIIPITVLSPRLGKEGWAFANADPYPGAENDPCNDSHYLKDVYLKAKPDYEGRFSVPTLWDKKRQTIVNNESSEIIRIFNSAFNNLLPPEKAALDFYPTDLRAKIDEVNEWILSDLNAGVYKTGLAPNQEGYTKGVFDVFNALDRVEKMLTGKDYLIGDRLTEADVRLWVTIIRFDPVYVGHFKCNLRTIRDGYPAIHTWLRKLYWKNDAFKLSTNFDHIKTNYYWSHDWINPTRIIPAGPIPNIKPL